MEGDLLKFGVRLLHTLAAAYVVGGALFLWIAWPRLGTTSPAEQYERGFWLAVGLLAATGVGNLAAFSGGLPGPGTQWGGTLLLKLDWGVLMIAQDT
jgi:putative copper export protein